MKTHNSGRPSRILSCYRSLLEPETHPPALVNHLLLSPHTVTIENTCHTIYIYLFIYYIYIYLLYIYLFIIYIYLLYIFIYLF